MDKILGLQVPLESTLYKRALQELEKSCGQMCVDGLAEFNRKYAGENLDVACINLGSSNWSWRLANKAMWFLRWLWSNLVMQLPACSLRLVAVLTPSFCVCVCVCVWYSLVWEARAQQASSVKTSRSHQTQANRKAAEAQLSPDLGNLLSDVACSGAIGCFLLLVMLVHLVCCAISVSQVQAEKLRSKCLQLWPRSSTGNA